MKIRSLIGMLPLLAASFLQGQAPTQRGLVLAQDNLSFPAPLMGSLRWTANRLAGCDYCNGARATLWAMDRQGNREAVAFEIPGAGYTRVRDVASGPDGSLTAVGFAISGDSRQGTFIAWISPDTTRQVITRVWPYDPQVVTVAADATIWTLGSMFNDRDYVQYPNVLRHYTSSGQLLASTIVHGVRKNNGGTYKVGNTSTLMASNDRIGWLTAACQYIEFSFEAVPLGSYSCPNGYTSNRQVSGAALSATDDLLVEGKGPAPLAPLQLDRGTNTWNPAPVYQDTGETRRLLGFDGTTLVTWSAASYSMRRYVWADQPAAGGQ